MMIKEPSNAVEQEIRDLEMSIMATRQKIRELLPTLPQEEITDYEMTTLDGETVSLSSLFGDSDEMILIHNMGPQCSYCTLWADGFNSLVPYFKTRCSFVLETDIPAADLKTFATDRGWGFDVVSSHGTTLKKDMGFQNPEMNLPGVSTFFKGDDGKIYRHAASPFGPGDPFCSPWHLFDLLKKGVNEWSPNYNK